MKRFGFTITEILVVSLILMVLVAILCPILSYTREKGRQAICLHNQQQIAIESLIAAQDRDGRFPTAETFWEALHLAPRMLTCPSETYHDGNCYVLNNMIAGADTEYFAVPQNTMISADGEHSAKPARQEFANIAYSSTDLLARHRKKYIASFLDGHVELTRMAPHLIEMPCYNNTVLWLYAGQGVEEDRTTSSLSRWMDQSRFRHPVTPAALARAPVLVDSVSTLGKHPALFFNSPPGQQDLLETVDVSGAWTENEGTVIIVYQPIGNDDSEYTVLDQSNGDDEQATRMKITGDGASGSSSLAPIISFAPGNGNGNGQNKPEISLTASASAVAPGASVQLTWGSINADEVQSSNFGAGTVNGTVAVTVNATTTYTITVKGYGQATASVSVTVVEPPPTVTLTANPPTINRGQSTTLSWSSTNATSATSNFGASSLSGSRIVSPNSTTTYSIVVTGPGGTDNASMTVVVNDDKDTVSVTLQASPMQIYEGESCTLTWSSEKGNGFSSNFGANGLSGSVVVWPTVTTEYSITVSQGSKSATDRKTVTVIPCPITITLSANPEKINPGEQVRLSWSSNATSVVTSNFGAGSTSGTILVSPKVTTTYGITLRKGMQRVTAIVKVQVVSGAGSGSKNGIGMISWFRGRATADYPVGIPYNTPVCLTVSSSSSSYRAFLNGVACPSYQEGPDWLAPEKLYIGGSPHGSNANRRHFTGYIAEVIVYNKALSDFERRQVEQYLMKKYQL